MFGFVTAHMAELDEAQKSRYQAVYCGICRQIREQSGQRARLCLSYDMTFLALLLLSLYEPEETGGPNACKLHPIQKRPWVYSHIIGYCADMNVALAYYNCMDNWQDDRSLRSKTMARWLRPSLERIETSWPRQCQAIKDCIAHLSQLEKEQCANPDTTANCFGALMSELLVYQEDLWADSLREMGRHLGRFIYLADAAVDYRKDKRKKKYNPYLAMGSEENWPRWEEYLVLAMGRCTYFYEKLPLVQDKALLDNVLYSGVWINFGRMRKEAGRDAGSV